MGQEKKGRACQANQINFTPIVSEQITSLRSVFKLALTREMQNTRLWWAKTHFTIATTKPASCGSSECNKIPIFALLQIRRSSRLHLVKQRCKAGLLLLSSSKMSTRGAAAARLGTCETLAKSCATILFLMMVSCCLGSNAQVPLDHLSHFNPCPFNPQCQCSTGGKQKREIRWSSVTLLFPLAF